MKLEFSGQVFEKYSIPNLMKTRWVADELFDADGQRDRHDEAKSRFSQICKSA